MTRFLPLKKSIRKNCRNRKQPMRRVARQSKNQNMACCRMAAAGLLFLQAAEDSRG